VTKIYSIFINKKKTIIDIICWTNSNTVSDTISRYFILFRGGELLAIHDFLLRNIWFFIKTCIWISLYYLKIIYHGSKTKYYYGLGVLRHHLCRESIEWGWIIYRIQVIKDTKNGQETQNRYKFLKLDEFTLKKMQTSLH